MNLLPKILKDIQDLKSAVHKLSTAQQPIKGSIIDLKDNRINFTYNFESPSALAADAFSGALGAVIYDTLNFKNAFPTISFVKKSNWTLREVILYAKFFPGRKDNGSANIDCYPQNVRFRLNGTRTRTTTGAYPADIPFYRVNGGTILTMDGQPADNVTPSSDGQEYTHTMSALELAAFGNGWNTVVCQADTSDGNNYGYAKLNLVVSGYEEL